MGLHLRQGSATLVQHNGELESGAVPLDQELDDEISKHTDCLPIHPHRPRRDGLEDAREVDLSSVTVPGRQRLWMVLGIDR